MLAHILYIYHFSQLSISSKNYLFKHFSYNWFLFFTAEIREVLKIHLFYFEMQFHCVGLTGLVLTV